MNQTASLLLQFFQGFHILFVLEGHFLLESIVGNVCLNMFFLLLLDHFLELLHFFLQFWQIENIFL